MGNKGLASKSTGSTTNAAAAPAGGLPPAPALRFNDLQPLVDRTLHEWAKGWVRRERPSETLDPATLVQEAYAKMLAQDQSRFESVNQFRALASMHMRRYLVDRARRHKAAKHDGGRQRITLSDSLGPTVESKEVDILAIDEALTALKQVDLRAAELVHLRFFGGLTIPEAAKRLGISERTAVDDWTHARAWLASRLAIEFRAEKNK